MPKHFRKGLDGRLRDRDGEIHKKRGDTLVKTLRKEYGDSVASGYRSDTKLATVLGRKGVATAAASSTGSAFSSVSVQPRQARRVKHRDTRAPTDRRMLTT